MAGATTARAMAAARASSASHTQISMCSKAQISSATILAQSSFDAAAAWISSAQAASLPVRGAKVEAAFMIKMIRQSKTPLQQNSAAGPKKANLPATSS